MRIIIKVLAGIGLVGLIAIPIAIGIIVSFVFPRIFNHLEERRLNNSGITTYGQIIGIWQISEQRSMAIYMFPIDSIYHTGRFGFPCEYNINKGDGVRVVYLENRPNVSRALEVLPIWRDLCNSNAIEYSKQEKYSQINE